jgi:hypothetical protein
VVAHACNPTYLGGVGRRIRFWEELLQKQETLSET